MHLFSVGLDDCSVLFPSLSVSDRVLRMQGLNYAPLPCVNPLVYEAAKDAQGFPLLSLCRTFDTVLHDLQININK